MKTNSRKHKVKRADNISGWIFIAVAMIIFVMFTLYPVISAVITSLQKYKPFGSEWVGMKNYVDALQSSLFWKSIKNTVIFLESVYVSCLHILKRFFQILLCHKTHIRNARKLWLVQ